MGIFKDTLKSCTKETQQDVLRKLSQNGVSLKAFDSAFTNMFELYKEYVYPIEKANREYLEEDWQLTTYRDKLTIELVYQQDISLTVIINR